MSELDYDAAPDGNRQHRAGCPPMPPGVQSASQSRDLSSTADTAKLAADGQHDASRVGPVVRRCKPEQEAEPVTHIASEGVGGDSKP